MQVRDWRWLRGRVCSMLGVCVVCEVRLRLLVAVAV